jgi:hypothetical protein
MSFSKFETKLPWDGDIRGYVTFRQEFGRKLRANDAYNIPPEIVPTHGERETIRNFMYDGLARLYDEHEVAISEREAGVLQREWLLSSGWDRYEDKHSKLVRERQKQVNAYFKCLDENVSPSISTNLQAAIDAGDPHMAQALLDKLGKASKTSGTAAAITDFVQAEWTEGTVRSFNTELSELSKQLEAHGEPKPTENMHNALLRNAVYKAHGELFSTALYSLGKGADDGTPYSTEKHLEGLRLQEDRVGCVWEYKAAHPEKYQLSTKAPPIKAGSGPQARAYAADGVNCSLCGGPHYVRNCELAETCNNCGWRFIRGTKCNRPAEKGGPCASFSGGGGNNRGGRSRSNSTTGGKRTQARASMASMVEAMTESMAQLVSKVDVTSAKVDKMQAAWDDES